MNGGFDLAALRSAVAADGAVVRVLVAASSGSTPRETGAAMLVGRRGSAGTIGGGALELAAMRTAHRLLGAARPWAREVMRLPLGPALGQCCGGHVTLLLERYGPDELATVEGLAGTGAVVRPVTGGPAPAADLAAAHAARALGDGAVRLEDGLIVEPVSAMALPVWLYGAGHVGRAIVRAATDLPLAVTWIDTAPDRFPDVLPPHAVRLVASAPQRVVAHAPDEAVHLVLTYSHAIDLDVCHAVLGRRFGHLGLIGSASKRARFLARLRALGHPETALARLECPIGDRTLGKAPAAIALGVVADLLRRAEPHAIATGGRA